MTATLAGPIAAPIDSPLHARATHRAIIAAECGVTLTRGIHPRAPGVILCPSQGVVSVWPLGSAPASTVTQAIPWVLVSGPGCQVLRKQPQHNGTDAQSALTPVPSNGTPVSISGPVGSSITVGSTVNTSTPQSGSTVPTALVHSHFSLQAPTVPWQATGLSFIDDWIEALSDTYGCPRGMAGTMTLAALAGALCSRQRVHMQTQETHGNGHTGAASERATHVAWVEPHCGLFMCGVAPSGMKKSPLYEALLAPWQERQALQAASHESQVNAWASRVSRARNQIERMEASEESAEQSEELARLYGVMREPEPRAPALWVNNATGAAFGAQLAYEPHVFVATAEASEIFSALQTSDGRMDLEPLLEAYSGAIRGTTLRISRAQPATGAPWRASVMAMTQPKALFGLGLKHSVALEQGLFARFTWSCVDVAAPPRGAVDVDLRKRWVELIGGLMTRPGPARNPWGVETGDPFTVHASPSQTAQLLAFSEELQSRANPGGDLYEIDTWVRKAHGGVARIAAVLSGVEGLSPQMDERFLAWAIAYTREYLLLHAQYAWALTTWPENTNDAEHLFALAKVRAADIGGRTSFAQLEVDAWLPRWSPTRVDKAIATLASRGYAVSTGRERTDRMVTFV